MSSMDMQVFEEYGPVVNGRGTSSVEVSGINWKNSADPAQPYHLNPLRRPTAKGDLTFSYKKYNYLKISGTYNAIKRAKLAISVGGGADGQATTGFKLYYKFTNTYAQPDNLFDGSMILAADGSSIVGPILLPLSPDGPHVFAPYQEIHNTPNQTLYSPYLVTQLVVTTSDKTVLKDIMDDTGNIPGYKIEFSYVEY